MRDDVLTALIAGATQAEDDRKLCNDLVEEVKALVRVYTQGYNTWVELWRSWRSLEDARVDIVENNQWKQIIRSVLTAHRYSNRTQDKVLAERAKNRFGLRDDADEPFLIEAEIRMLLTLLFRPDTPNRRVTLEVVELLNSGRSGALTFLVQPRLRIEPSPDDPTTGVDSRIGRVSIVKLDDVGVIAREYAGFCNVVDRYLYSYAARVSRVAKGHTLGALAYASVGGLDDYVPVIGGARSPVSLRDFLRGSCTGACSDPGSKYAADPNDVQSLVAALDRCIFADLHQDSREGLLGFYHYSDFLPPDYEIQDADVGFISRGTPPGVFDAAHTRPEEERGACDGRVVSVGRNSMVLLGNAHEKIPADMEADERRKSWSCINAADPAIGKNRALIRLQTGGASAHGVGVYLTLAKHMKPESVPSLELVAYGCPTQKRYVLGSEVLEQMLSSAPGVSDRICELPSRLLSLLRRNRVSLPARVGSCHGDLNLTNVLVTFVRQELSGSLDPRCWLIDYGYTRLDGHTGRDYAQLEIGLRIEVMAPAYMELARRVTACAYLSREQAHALILSYHWALEEQLLRYDTSPPTLDALSSEFETVAMSDGILPVVAKLANVTDIGARVEAFGSESQMKCRGIITQRATQIADILPLDIGRAVFAYLSPDATLRRCYSFLRMVRNLALRRGHGRIEQAWAQMLAGLSTLDWVMPDVERLGSLQREVVALAILAAAEEIRWNLQPEALSALNESSASTPYHSASGENQESGQVLR